MAKFHDFIQMKADVSTIGVLHRLNHRKDYGSADETNVLNSSMAREGWWVMKPTILYVPNDESLLLEAQAEREKEWVAMQEMAFKANTPEARLELQAWELTYVRRGKIPVPTYLNNCTFRRFSQLAKANYLRLAGKASFGPDGKGMILEPITEIPAIGRIFATDADRIEDQFKENWMDKEGSKDTSPIEKLLGVRALFLVNQNEATVGRAFGLEESQRSTLQKVYGILKCDFVYPEVQLIDRLALPVDSPRNIPWKPLKKECVRTVGSGKLWKEAGPECTTPLMCLEKHIREIVAKKDGQGSTSTEKPMKKEDQLQYAKEASALDLRDAFKAATTGDLTGIARLNKYVKAYNVLRGFTLDGVNPDNLAAYIAKFDPAADYTS